MLSSVKEAKLTILIDLRKLKKVEIDVGGMSITAGGGCQAVDLEAPLQGI